MANEINKSATLTSSKNGLTITGYGQKYADQAGAPMIASIQEIGTDTEVLDIGDITDLGHVFVKNLDANNTVKIGLNTPVVTGDALITIPPLDFCLFPTQQETIYAIATGTACLCEVVGIST